MKITWKSIGQRCTGTTRTGQQCRLPASTIAGGLAVCPYHIAQAIKLFNKISSQSENRKHAAAFESARRDSTIYI